MSEKLLERLRISIKKIDLLQRLTALPPALQVEELGQVFMQYEETKSSSDHDFKIWLIRAIGEINTLESRKLLKHIWRKARYGTTMRYEAQEALVQSGVITDTERTIIFLNG